MYAVHCITCTVYRILYTTLRYPSKILHIFIQSYIHTIIHSYNHPIIHSYNHTTIKLYIYGMPPYKTIVHVPLHILPYPHIFTLAYSHTCILYRTTPNHTTAYHINCFVRNQTRTRTCTCTCTCTWMRTHTDTWILINCLPYLSLFVHSILLYAILLYAIPQYFLRIFAALINNKIGIRTTKWIKCLGYNF